MFGFKEQYLKAKEEDFKHGYFVLNCIGFIIIGCHNWFKITWNTECSLSYSQLKCYWFLLSLDFGKLGQLWNALYVANKDFWLLTNLVQTNLPFSITVRSKESQKFFCGIRNSLRRYIFPFVLFRYLAYAIEIKYDRHSLMFWDLLCNYKSKMA